MSDSFPQDGPGPPRVPDHDLVRCIGRGSFGEVWLARNVFGAYRAVKLVYLRTFETPDPFEREFHGIQQYDGISRSHPGLVDVLHAGRNDEAGYFYYMMELADDASPPGQPVDRPSSAPSDATVLEPLPFCPETYKAKTLKVELENRGALPYEECLRTGLLLTSALAHLHEHKLLHRDIKPANIIFVGGLPKLADIGLVTTLTRASTFVGTEGYVPPDGPGTPQADIYALGKVLYQLWTGKDRLDFPELPADLTERSEPTRLLQFQEVVSKACHRRREERYQAALELHADLERLEDGRRPKAGARKPAVGTASDPASFPIVSASPAVEATPRPAPDMPNQTEIELVLGYDLESFTPSKCKALIAAISELLKVGQEITIKRIRSGSTILTLALTAEQAELVVQAVERGALSRLDVVEARYTEPDPDAETADFVPARRSLLSRLRSADLDEPNWAEFYTAYSRLVLQCATRAGLSDSDAQEFLQETLISIVRKMPNTQNVQAPGAIRDYVFKLIRRRTADALGKRSLSSTTATRTQDSSPPAVGRSIGDVSGAAISEADWNQEWSRAVQDLALERVKARVATNQFQIFDLHVLKEKPARQVAAILNIPLSSVYLAKHRVLRLLTKETGSLETIMAGELVRESKPLPDPVDVSEQKSE